MAKTTIELPDELKRQVEDAAKLEHRTQTEIIREAIEEAMQKKRIRRGPAPKPTLPLFTDDSMFPPDLAENIDKYLEGFGED
jgi:hypothetical protein